MQEQNEDQVSNGLMEEQGFMKEETRLSLVIQKGINIWLKERPLGYKKRSGLPSDRASCR
jgi:hypothetical protein